VKAIVEATNAGDEAKDPQANERKAQAEIERLQTLKCGQREAADQAGNELAEKIAEHQDEWQASLAERAGELAAAYDEALLSPETFQPPRDPAGPPQRDHDREAECCIVEDHEHRALLPHRARPFCPEQEIRASIEPGHQGSDCDPRGLRAGQTPKKSLG
jgi:hypothetical protein